MASEAPLNTMSLDRKPPAPSSTDVLASEPKVNGNSHSHDPLFDDTAAAPLTNGDSHLVEPSLKPEVATKSSILDTVGPVTAVASGAPTAAQLPSEDIVTAAAVTEPVQELPVITSVPAPVEQPTSDVRDETPLEPATNSSTSLPAATTEQTATDETFEDNMDTQEDAIITEHEPVNDSSMIEPTSEISQQEHLTTETPTATETETAMATATDAEMVDAQEVDTRASSLVRQREDGEDETEPNAKRLKLNTTNGDAEFKVPDMPASAAPTDYGTPVTASSEDYLNSKPMDDQPITKSQVKFLLDAVRKTKKTKAAGPFLQRVDDVALNLPTYYQVITKPMDLGTMEQKLKDGTYSSVDEALFDMDQIVKNSFTFNGSQHQVSTSGLNMRAYFMKLMNHIPTGDKARDEEINKKPPQPQPKPAPVRRESRATARSPTNKANETNQGFLDPQGVPLIRRDSNNNDRPKREIHRPPPRDLPYSVRPNKRNKLELAFCQSVLQEMLKGKYASIRAPFDYPVDPVALNIPHYFKIVKHPMDLSTVSSNLKNGTYPSAKEFHADMKLIFQNCYKFNPPADAVFNMGKQTEELFDRLWQDKKQYMSQHRRESEAPSDDEDEGSEDMEDEEEEPAADPAQQRMLEIQKQIAQLNAEAMALAEGHKVDKKKKKGSSKPAKSGDAGKSKRQSTGAAKPTKEKPAKKPVKKWKKLTLDQKRQVSEGIGNLEEKDMRKAVQIIRNGVPHLKDVHDDELELDIEEIPDDVIYELWEFVRKVQPKTQYVADEDDDYEEERGHKAAGAATQRKKNKPMTAKEQESKIAQVQAQLARFGGGQSPAESPAGAQDESSDDEAGSDESSEEE